MQALTVRTNSLIGRVLLSLQLCDLFNFEAHLRKGQIPMKLSIFAAMSVLACSSVFAQASSKATAAINTAVGCTLSAQTTIGDTLPQVCHDIFSGAAVTVTADNFATIMTSTVKLSSSQSLFVSPSLVTGLYTQTKVKSSPGTSSTSVASGGVFLRAILTNQATGEVIVGYPAAVCNANILGCHADASGTFGVTLDSRVQSLTQSISDCIVAVTGGGSGTCTFDLTTDLVLKTTSAHTFNFIFPSVGQGTFTVAIQTAVSSDAMVSGSGTAVGAAAYGLGSVTIETVRLVQSFSF
jgi:hypothetical protein